MAVTVDQASLGTQAQSGASSSQTTSAAVASGGTIVALAQRFNSGGSVDTLSMSGGSLTWVQAHTVASGNIRLSLFYAHAPAGLASGTTVTLNTSGGASDFTWGMFSVLGVDTGSTVDSFNGGSAATAAWSGLATTSEVGDAIVGGAGSDGSLLTSVIAGDNVEWLDFNSATTGGSVTGVYDLNAEVNDIAEGTWSGAQSHVALSVAFNASGGVTEFPSMVVMAQMIPGG